MNEPRPSVHFSSLCLALAMACLVLCAGFAAPAYAVHESLVTDNHPAGGGGATGEQIIVPSHGQPGSPLFEGPEAPGIPHLHGPWPGSVSTGHPDPHALDVAHFLGHGIGQPITHASPPSSSPPPSVSVPGHDHDSGHHAALASRDVALREVVIPLGPDGRTQGEGAELAALLGQSGWFDALFVERREPPVTTTDAPNTAASTAPTPSPEENARYDELIALNQEFATRTAQMREVTAQFNARIATLDTLIAEARANGTPELADKFEQEQAELITRREERRDMLLRLGASAGRALNAAYARNEEEGVGPGNGDELVAAMAARGDLQRTRLVDGKAVEVSTLAGDATAITGTRDSSQRLIAGAGGSTPPEASIFTDPTELGAWGDLYLDYYGTAFEYIKDPQLFAARYAAYAKGAGLAVKDGLVELATLGVELVDTNLEIQQAALNAMFGTEIDVFGSENIEFLYNTAAAAAQLDSNTFFTTTDRFLSHFERRFEQMAGSGEKGIREALEGTGYVFTTIVGGEEIAFKAIALGAKGVKIVRLGRADEVLQGGEEIAQAGDALADAGRAGQAPATAALLDGPGGRVLRLPDGEELAFGEFLGGGGTSRTYAVAGKPGLVIKETGEGANRFAGAVFDSAGQRMLNDIDPALAARQFGDPIIIDGKQYTVFERADPFQETRFREAQAQGVEIPMKTDADGKLVPDKARIELEMSPGQLAAYQEGIAKLNDRGFVFMDGKVDNWALVKVGEPDQYQMKIIDPGSIVKLTDADAARRLQQKLDAAQNGPEIDGLIAKGSPWGMQALREQIVEEFDQFIDKAAMQAYGAPIESFADVAYNPVHGYQNPSVRALYEVDIASLSDTEFADFLRKQGWSDAQIEEIMDLPPQLRADSVRAPDGGSSGAGAGAAGGEMSDADMRDFLRRQDPGYWTEERLRAYFETPPPPSPWADEIPDLGDDVPTQVGGVDAGFREAVTEIDASNATAPPPPPRLSFLPAVPAAGDAAFASAR